MFIEDMHLYFEKKSHLSLVEFMLKLKSLSRGKFENKAIENRLAKEFQKIVPKTGKIDSRVRYLFFHLRTSVSF